MQDRFENFTGLIQKIDHIISRIKAREMAEYGLKGIHGICMFFLQKYPEGLTRNELIEKSGEDKASISRALALLIEKSYIKEIPSENNSKYKIKLALSEEGGKIAAQLSGIVESAVLAASAGISPGERETLYKALFLISENLEKIK